VTWDWRRVWDWLVSAVRSAWDPATILFGVVEAEWSEDDLPLVAITIVSTQATDQSGTRALMWRDEVTIQALWSLPTAVATLDFLGGQVNELTQELLVREAFDNLRSEVVSVMPFSIRTESQVVGLVVTLHVYRPEVWS